MRLTILGYVLMISGHTILYNGGNPTLAIIFFGGALPVFMYLFWKQIQKWNKNR